MIKDDVCNGFVEICLVAKTKDVTGPNFGLALEVHVEAASLVYDADSCLSLADLGGGRARRAPPPTGPDSFILTCKIFKM